MKTNKTCSHFEENERKNSDKKRPICAYIHSGQSRAPWRIRDMTIARRLLHFFLGLR